MVVEHTDHYSQKGIMSSGGWIKLHRQVMEHPDYLAEKFTRMGAWIDLLLLAGHDAMTTRIRGIRVEAERGQVVMAEKELAPRWQWSRNKVRKYLAELQAAGQIVQQKNNVTSYITILNYDKYQIFGPGDPVVPFGVQRHQKDTKKTPDPASQKVPRTVQQKNGATYCNTDTDHDTAQFHGTAESTANDTAEICGTIGEKGTAYIQEYKKNKNIHTQYSDKLLRDKNARERVSVRDTLGDGHARELLDWIAERFPAIAGMPEPLNEQQAVWLLKKYDAGDIRRLLAQMDSNRVPESGKKSVFAVITGYVGQDFILRDKKQNGAGQRHYTYTEVCDLVTSGKYRSGDFCKVEVDGGNYWVMRSASPAGKNGKR